MGFLADAGWMVRGFDPKTSGVAGASLVATSFDALTGFAFDDEDFAEFEAFAEVLAGLGVVAAFVGADGFDDERVTRRFCSGASVRSATLRRLGGMMAVCW